MNSPWGGDRGGGRKPKRKRGGQPGNVNRRASDFLPPAKDTDERRAFLDALDLSEETSLPDKLRVLLDLAFARVASMAESVGVTKVLKSLTVIDALRRTEIKLGKLDAAAKREAAKDAAIADLWQAVCQCETCSERVDRILTGLELNLKQLGGEGDEQWLERTAQNSEA